MKSDDLDVLRRRVKHGALESAARPSSPSVRNEATQSESDQSFYAFCSAVLNSTSALLVTFSYGLSSPGSQDEVDILIRASVLSIVVASSAGFLSWIFPLLGTAFLCGIFLAICYLFASLAIFGDQDPISLFLQGWIVCSTLLYVIMKTKTWSPF